MTVRKLFCCAVLLLGACAEHDPTEIVQTREQAVAIANKECGEPGVFSQGHWYVEYNKGEWYLRRGALAISIHARNGKTSGCILKAE